MIEEPEKKPSNPINNPETGLKSRRDVHICSLCPWSQWSVTRDLLYHTSLQVIFKSNIIATYILMHPGTKFSSILNKMYSTNVLPLGEL